MSRYLVIAKHEEDVSWVSRLPGRWIVLIYNKGQDGDIENFSGREAHTYLLAIVSHYDSFFKGDAEIVFCQGNPFDHDPDFISHLETHTEFGSDWSCGPTGLPDCDYVQMDDYCRVFGLPVQMTYGFVTGAQFKVTGEQIHQHPIGFYKALLGLTEMDNKSAWTLERMWRLIFQK